MKSIFFIGLLVMSLLVQAQDLRQYQQQFDKELKVWSASFRDFKLSDFGKTKIVKFENIEKQDLSRLDSFLLIYKPVLAFGIDQTDFIDIYSYQLNLVRIGNTYKASPEIDQAVYLFDSSKNFWGRIYFGTSIRWIDDVCWISKEKFILAGCFRNNAGNKVPFIMIGDIGKETLDVFENKNTSCIQGIENFRSPQLKAIKI